ncbi:MAG: enoyl-CoA hydratase [Betaproteobacteria bacterium]|nr:enoyl-CoA hydratase [Betaproteobacteria bacterium]
MNAPLEASLQPPVLAETHDGVCTLTLNRGDRFNPLSTAMIAALDAALDAVAADRAVRVVVLAGAGRAFCAGHDLTEMRAHIDADWQRGLFDACTRMMLKLTQIPQPVIARVHGAAAAAGCQLVSMCDLAVAADSVRFGLSGINAGIFCSTPAVGVARNVARKRAMEMLLTGELIDARTALDWGLVNRVVPGAELDAAVQALAATIARKSAAAVALGKRAFYAQVELGLAGAYALAGETMACNMVDPDAAEGIDAFLGKRPPVWRGD